MSGALFVREIYAIICGTNPMGVIRFRRDMLRSDRASWILVGHVKNEEKK